MSSLPTTRPAESVVVVVVVEVRTVLVLAESLSAVAEVVRWGNERTLAPAESMVSYLALDGEVSLLWVKVATTCAQSKRLQAKKLRS